MNEEAIKAAARAIIESEDSERIYDIYDRGTIGDPHELWLACCRFRKLVEALEALVNLEGNTNVVAN